MTDAQLLASYATRGSQEAFARLVRRYSPLVHGTCIRVLGDSHAAEDAMQAAFMVLARKADRLTAEVVLGDWLFWTARNCAMNLAKARRRRARHEREAAMEASRNAGRNPEKVWRRISPLLDSALAALPRRQREAATLYYCAGMNQTEIAREIGISQKAVSKRIGDALRNLRHKLARGGVTVPATTLGALLLERAASPVPPALVESIVTGCLGAAAVSSAASAATRSVLRTMLWGKVKTVTLALTSLAAVAIAAATAATPGPAPVLPAAAPGSEMVILGKRTLYRTHLVFKTPVVITPEGKVRIALSPTWNKRKEKGPKPMGEYQSPLPPADWKSATFDDIVWPRKKAPVEVQPGSATGRRLTARHSATRSSLICLRGKFHVADPARVRGLKLSLTYVGGAAVYLNGKELKRGHLPEGELTAEKLAEKYPDDLYVVAGKDFLQRERMGKRFGRWVKNEAERAKNQANFDRRYRKMESVTIDSKLLRKGENVLAVQIHRAPVNVAACKAKFQSVGGMYRVQGIWSYAGLTSLRLTAAPGSPVRPNNGRPAGIQVWNCLPFDTVSCHSWGDTGDALKPIHVPAVRNGLFSGRLVVSSQAAIRGLKVTVSDLTTEKKQVISTSSIRVRLADRPKAWVPAARYDGLVEEFPAEIPVVKAKLSRRGPTVSGAAAPVWITVRVPKDAEPGTYKGIVTVQAQGLNATKIPFELAVYGWTLPDSFDFRMHNLADLSPENLAKHYKVPLWSERHFELMANSMKLMGDVGSRRIEINLATNYHGVPGNSESVVRWIKKPGGGFDHDFSVLEKFLDTVATTIKKPLPLRLNCWGVVDRKNKNKIQSSWGKCVTLLDPKTKKLEPFEQPIPGTPESVKFWKPVFDGIRERVKKRGWEDVLSAGHQSYCWLPTPDMVDALHQMWPAAVWSFTAHNGTLGAVFKGKKARIPVRYSECVWTQGRLSARGYKKLLARKDKRAVWNSVARCWHRDYSPLFRLRQLPEDMIMRGHDGVGQLGVDLFPLKSGRRNYHLNRGRGGLGPECSTRAILAPGKNGAIPTERYEMFREGVQLSEAILFLQQALNDKKVDGDLAARVDKYLTRRGTAYVNGWWEGQFSRDEQLFALAGEVAKKLGK